MELAERDEYELPHIDWVSSGSGSVYRSTGKPDTDFDPDADHAVSWYPNDGQIEAYIDVLESLDVGDAVVMCANGPAPLKGKVVETGDNYIVSDLETGGSPPRRIEWDSDEPYIGQRRAEDEYATLSDVYHIEEYNGVFVTKDIDTEKRADIGMVDDLQREWGSMDEETKYAVVSAIDTLSTLQKDWDSLGEDEKYAMVSEAKVELLNQQ